MIGDVVAWVRRHTRTAKLPWVVVGKGPSLEQRDRIKRLWGYDQFTINHAFRVMQPTLAHFTDWHTYCACAEEVIQLACPVVIPWRPHVKMSPGNKTLQELAVGHASLRQLIKRGRLLSYNSGRTRTRHRHAKLSVIRVRCFSAVAVVNVLATAGIRAIYTLGVDGGMTYAKGFDNKNLLANGQPNFDSQFVEFERTTNMGVTIIPLLSRCKD